MMGAGVDSVLIPVTKNQLDHHPTKDYKRNSCKHLKRFNRNVKTRHKNPLINYKRIMKVVKYEDGSF